MIKSLLRIDFLIGLLLVGLVATACEQKAVEHGNEELLRVGDRILTVLDFNEAFEISKTAYAHNIRQQSEDLRDAQLRLLNQLTIELLMLERAEELGVGLTDAELQEAVTAIKSDYPEGEFEQTLIEFAVSYDAWLNRLRIRLIMDKLVEAELKNRVSISAEDISEYYQKNYQGKQNRSEGLHSSEEINEAIVRQLRREKKEQAYKIWIEELKAKYPIEINSEQWDRIAEPEGPSQHESNKSLPEND